MKKIFALLTSLSLILSPVTPSYGSTDGKFEQIFQMASGTIGSTILIKCPSSILTPSIGLYFTGSAAYIAGEIIAAEKKRDSMTELSERAETVVNSGDNSQYQSETSLIATDNEKANLRYVESRLRSLTAVNIILATATTAAIGETIFLGGGVVVCPPPNPANTAIEIAAARTLAGAFNFLQNSNGEFKLGGMASGVIRGAFSDKIFNLIEGALSIKSPIVNSALNNGVSRSILLGAIAASSLLARRELNNSKESINSNISQLEQVNAQFEDGTGHGISAGSLNSSAARKTEIKKLPEVSKPRKCIGEKFEYSTASCSKKLKINKVTVNFSNEVPGLQAAVNTATDYAQAIVDGDFARADVLRGNLESSAARINKMKEDLQKRLNTKLVSEGKKPIDLNLESKKIMDQIRSDFAKTEAGAKFLAEESSKTQDKKSEPTQSAQSASAAPKDDLDLSSLSDGDGESEADINHDAIAALKADMQSSDGEGEIKKDPEESLFKQVSKRYFLNYERFFKKKEEVK